MALRGTAFQYNTVSATTIAVTVSGISIQNNDIVLIFCDGGSNATYTLAGFSAIPGLSHQTVNGNGMNMLYKIASGEPSSYTITASQNDFHCAQVRAYSGRNTSALFTNVAATASTNGGTTPITMAITGLSAASGDDVVEFVGTDAGNTNTGQTYTFSNPTGFGNLILNSSIGAQFQSILASNDFANNPGGATGTLAPVLSETAGGNHSYFYGGYVISLAQTPIIPTLPPFGPMPKQIYIMP